MEIDGKEFYLKASQSSKNKLGKKLLGKLAAEEDEHRATFQNIYTEIKDKKGWPNIRYQGDGGQRLRTLFAEALDNMDKNTKSCTAELDDVKTAMKLENQTYDF